MLDCVFCKLYNKKSLFLESDYFWVNIDKYPVSVGHLEIIPKRHIKSYSELNTTECVGLVKFYTKVKKVIKNTDWKKMYSNMIPINQNSKKFIDDVLNSEFIDKIPEAYNVGINEGIIAGQTISHLHIHVIPRYKGDVDDFVGGVRHIIPDKGNYKK